MPANLPPDYHQAEERFRAAKSVEDKIACLEEMLRIMPKHKGTEKLQADLKTRLARFRRQPKKKGPTRDAGHSVRKEGAGQIALVGPPSSGKSALVASLTHARPEIADYPFTTREPVPGMMEFEDIAFQLVDLPPLSEQFVEPWVYDIIQHADLLWMVLEVENSLDELRSLQALLATKRIGAYPAGAVVPEPPEAGWTFKPALLVLTGVDHEGGPEDVEIVKGLLDAPWPIVAVSAPGGVGLESLRRRTFELLDIVRVHTKQPGKPPDPGRPFTFPRGATVEDLARTIHKDVLEGFKFARVWGARVFDGQTVQREHVLDDGDVVEIHR